MKKIDYKKKYEKIRKGQVGFLSLFFFSNNPFLLKFINKKIYAKEKWVGCKLLMAVFYYFIFFKYTRGLHVGAFLVFFFFEVNFNNVKILHKILV